MEHLFLSWQNSSKFGLMLGSRKGSLAGSFSHLGIARTRSALPSAQENVYSLFFESIQMVTGPSLTSDTCMSAPKRPVATGRSSSSPARRTKAS